MNPDDMIALAERCCAEVGRYEGQVVWVKFHSQAAVESFAAAIATPSKSVLQALLDRYVALVNSGDAGNWNPEEEAEVIAARADLAAAARTADEPVTSPERRLPSEPDGACPCGCNYGEFPAALRTPAAPEAGKVQHPDDLAVDRFAAAMKAKMRKQRAKGYHGWETAPVHRLKVMLAEHITKGDPVDVANFAMMLHARGEGTWIGKQAAQPEAGSDSTDAAHGAWIDEAMRLADEVADAEHGTPNVRRLARTALREHLGMPPAAAPKAATQVPSDELLEAIVSDKGHTSMGYIIERLRIAFNGRTDSTDAARYRFLRDEAYEAVIPHGNTLGGKRTAWITKLHPGSSFDAAIDAALSGSGKGRA